MSRTGIACLLLSLVAGFGGRCPADEGETPWRVGVATVDITPDYPVRLNGFGFRRAESEGVRQPIHAKALAIQFRNEAPVVLICTDTLGIPDALVERLAKRLKEKAGLERARLSVTATHTHTAPMVNDVSPTLFGVPIPDEHQAHIDRYSREFEAGLEQAALAALDDRRSATLAWGIGKVGFARNRRRQGGPVDHDLPLLAIRNPDGTLRAVYLGYACHCVSLSDNRISGDWAGYAQAMIERQHPNCTALVSIGCGADANPSTGVVGDRAEVAEQHGVEIAEEVARLLAGPMISLTSPIRATQNKITLDLAPLPVRSEWEERAKLDNAIGHHARTMLARLDRGETLTTQIGYSIQTWQFGEQVAMVFLPGEVVADYALRLKRERDGHRLWVCGYANGCPGYIPSERVLREGGYEGGGAMTYYGIPGPYASGLEDAIVGEVLRQIPEGFEPPADATKTQGSLPRSPEQSRASLRPRPGFVVQLVAAEPLVASPVAIDFDGDGRLWVAEMYDYPSGVDNRFTPGGRVKRLTDTNGDGVYDEATLFLEGIPYPTGITVWRDGVLICAAPDILFARDTTGDGRADDVRRLFTGFATQNYQARVNSLEFGFDGWVYGACGLFGGQIQSVSTGDVVPLGQRDFRIDPDRGILEPVGGQTQQGRGKDDWGNWFGCTNSVLALHFPLEERYLSRNPFVRAPAATRAIVSGSDGGKMFPIAELVQFKLTGTAGQATAACGLGIYRDDLLGVGYRGNLFVCEPVNNLVHRRVLRPDSASFESHRSDDEPGVEFLASTDQWFRPVQARTGPDGALWVVDMYRYVIEHPTWIPPETLAELDVRAGSERGRIYRIYPETRPPRALENLNGLSAVELVQRLESPNGPVRDLAQQTLIWRDAKESAGALSAKVVSGINPAARMQALYTLQSLGVLPASTLVAALRDDHAEVRRHALRVAEHAFGDAEVAAAVLACRVDTVPLRIQLANSLGQWNDPRAAQRLAELALVSEESPYLTAAVLSSLQRENVALVSRQVLDTGRASDALIGLLLEQTISLANPTAVRDVLTSLVSNRDSYGDARTFARLSLLRDALARRTTDAIEVWDQPTRRAVREIVAAARSRIDSPDVPEEERLAAIGLVARYSEEPDDDARLLAKQLVPSRSPAVQRAAVDGLARLTHADVASLLLDTWPALTPALRGQVIEMLLSRSAWTRQLLDALAERAVPAADVDLVSRQRLLEHRDEQLRSIAQRVFSAENPAGTRQAVVEQYRAALPLAGDVERGRAVFRQRCATCHRLEEFGNPIAPDLSPYATKPAEALLIAVFDPNQTVDPRYQSYSILLNDGRVLSGMLAEETANNLTLLNAEGKRQDLFRLDVEELRASGRSLMPEGFERDLSLEAFADLLAYLVSRREKPKSLPGNTPQLVRGDATGTLRLPASHAEIYGSDITFEPPFGNIGYWHAQSDHVRWRFELPSAGELDVWLDYSCADASAGNGFAIESSAGELKGTVPATGGWDQFRQWKVGTIAMPAGAGELVVRPTTPVRGALFDLCAVALVRAGEQPAFDVQPPKSEPLPEDPASIARYILSDANPMPTRLALIEKHPELSDRILTVMTAGFSPGTPEEYRRIPWIWRVTVAAGKRNDSDELKRLLIVALPRPFEPMRDWQAVVLGGGLINGVSLAGDWPHARITALLADDAVLRERWNRSIELSFAMADDESVKHGTRYDAIRMAALAPWKQSRPLLEKYLAEGSHAELQMGAVSGLVDVPHPEATDLLLGALSYLPERNRSLALDGLLKSEDRVARLLDALEAGRLGLDVLGVERLKTLREHKNEALRNRALRLEE